MSRARSWLSALDKLTDREARALTAAGYLTGYLLALAWEARQERRAFERQLRVMALDFKGRIEEMRSQVPRPDAEQRGKQ